MAKKMVKKMAKKMAKKKEKVREKTPHPQIGRQSLKCCKLRPKLARIIHS